MLVLIFPNVMEKLTNARIIINLKK